MTVTLDVDGRVFIFAEGWQAGRWDVSSTYHRLRNQVPGSKAVDVVAVGDGRVLLLEVTDFTVWQTRKPVLKAPTVEETLQKVRDTLAGLLGASRNPSDGLHQRTAHGLMKGHGLVVALFNVEHYATKVARDRAAVRRSAFLNQLKQGVRWCGARAQLGGHPAEGLPTGIASTHPPV